MTAGKREALVMRRDGAAVWGYGVAYRVPRGVQIADDGQNQHGAHEQICRDDQCMVHATSVGPPLFPYANHVEPVTAIRERDVLRKSELVGAEYRGRYKDGTHWRWVETPGDLVFYEHLRTESAAYFDGVIDSMCWIERD